MSEAKIDPAVVRPLDLSEKGRRGKEVISLDRRLFMKFTAFTGVGDTAADAAATAAAARAAAATAAATATADTAATAPATAAAAAVEASGLVAAIYADANDPYGIGVMAASEDESAFVTTLRGLFNAPPFAGYTHKPELDMLGRSYSIGYEPDLEETLLTRPRQKLTDPRNQWVVWYPLQRSKRFYVLPEEHQRKILGEHGTLAKRYGAGGHATDIRLACHGLDKNDNDFIVGLLGPRLHPLSAVVQEMRRTEQTSQYLDRLGPFFIGKTVWQSKQDDA